jgi:hypothetical protein
MTLVLAVACSKSDDSASKPAPTDQPPTATSDAAAQALAVADSGAVEAADAAGDVAPDDTKPDDSSGSMLDPNIKPDPNEGPLKNIKALPKSWSRKQVTAYMKSDVTKGLGVKCKFCHDMKDLAKDGNEHKEEALKMIRMTNSINKESFGGKPRVTCTTCHKGKEEPKE